MKKILVMLMVMVYFCVLVICIGVYEKKIYLRQKELKGGAFVIARINFLRRRC